MEIIADKTDPRIKRTRQLLLQAFCDLAAEKDMRSISVQDITERATLNRATFYAHFRDKDALMDAAFRGLIREALAAKLSPSSPFGKRELRLLFCVICDFLDTTVRRCPRSHGESHPHIQSAVQEELSGFILDWLKQGLVQEGRQRFTPEMLATFVSWSLYGAAIEWSHSPAKLSQEVRAAQVVDLLMEGLGIAIPIASQA
jgi:AcrR family transcriptional regulator